MSAPEERREERAVERGEERVVGGAEERGKALEERSSEGSGAAMVTAKSDTSTSDGAETLEAIVEAAAQAERAKLVNVPPRMTSIAMVVPAKMLFGGT